MPIMPLDMLEGETVAACVARKNAALVEKRIEHDWLSAAHPDLLPLLAAWERSEGLDTEAWRAVERYLVANLKDDPA